MAKNPKGRGGTSSLRLVAQSGPKHLAGDRKPQPKGPKPIQLTPGNKEMTPNGAKK